MSTPATSRPSLIEQSLLGTTVLALVAMLSLPAARAASETFGWLPFWLLALPLSAWAVARTLRRLQAAEPRPVATVHRLPTARRRTPTSTADLSRAA